MILADRGKMFPPTQTFPYMFHTKDNTQGLIIPIAGLCRISPVWTISGPDTYLYPRSSLHQRIDCRVGRWQMPSPPRASHREHRSIEQISPEERHSLNINLMTSPPRQTQGFTKSYSSRDRQNRQINDLPGSAYCKERAVALDHTGGMLGDSAW